MTLGQHTPEGAIRDMQKGHGDALSVFLEPTPDDVPIPSKEEHDALSLDPHRSDMVVLTGGAEVGAVKDTAIGAASRFGHAAVGHVVDRPGTSIELEDETAPEEI